MESPVTEIKLKNIQDTSTGFIKSKSCFTPCPKLHSRSDLCY